MSSDTYSTDLSPNNGDGLNHIINAEIGLDANIGPYELFIIYEQNRKLIMGTCIIFIFQLDISRKWYKNFIFN